MARHNFGRKLILHILVKPSKDSTQTSFSLHCSTRSGRNLFSRSFIHGSGPTELVNQHVFDEATALQEQKSSVESYPLYFTLFPEINIEEVLQGPWWHGRTLIDR